MMNMAAEQQFGLGGKIVQGFGVASRNNERVMTSEISEFSAFSLKSVMSLSGFQGSNNLQFNRKGSQMFDVIGSSQH